MIGAMAGVEAEGTTAASRFAGWRARGSGTRARRRGVPLAQPASSRTHQQPPRRRAQGVRRLALGDRRWREATMRSGDASRGTSLRRPPRGARRDHRRPVSTAKPVLARTCTAWPDASTIGVARRQRTRSSTRLRGVCARFVENDHELVAAVASDEVAVADDADEPARQFDEHVVAGSMAELVVDRLEAVDVAEDEAECSAAGTGAASSTLASSSRSNARFSEAGERIVVRMVVQAVAGLGHGCDVHRCRHDTIDGLIVEEVDHGEAQGHRGIGRHGDETRPRRCAPGVRDREPSSPRSTVPASCSTASDDKGSPIVDSRSRPRMVV